MPAVWPLIARDEELATVLTHARGPGVVLAGAAGVGKTRLARETLTHARRTAREWRYVAATASARSVPLGAFADDATRLGDDPLARVGEVVDAVTRSHTGPPLVVIDDAHLLDAHSPWSRTTSCGVAWPPWCSPSVRGTSSQRDHRLVEGSPAGAAGAAAVVGPRNR
ncbi:MAG TPA: ATP-binding protein [Aldersonia sp.]